jgi:hypothetical protein
VNKPKESGRNLSPQQLLWAGRLMNLLTNPRTRDVTWEDAVRTILCASLCILSWLRHGPSTTKSNASGYAILSYSSRSRPLDFEAFDSTDLTRFCGPDWDTGVRSALEFLARRRAASSSMRRFRRSRLISCWSFSVSGASVQSSGVKATLRLRTVAVEEEFRMTGRCSHGFASHEVTRATAGSVPVVFCTVSHLASCVRCANARIRCHVPIFVSFVN